MRFRSFIIILLFASTFAFGQDSIPVLSRIELSLSPSQDFLPFIWENPALAGRIRTFSLIDLNLNGEIENYKNQLPQLGDGHKQGSFNADAQLRLKNDDYIWGKAFYKNGEKENVQWNETADFLKVYPYVALDTIGGDLKYEQYYFQGGYSKDYERFSWGISADFKEGIEYRDRDPRPKNITSDLNAKLGGAWKYSNLYLLAANINLGKYKQSNSVSFYSELGGSPIYNVLGLGLLNNRFWNSKADSYFTGSNYGGSLALVPHDLCGFSANVSYNRSSLNKRINNPSKIDLNRTVTQDAEGIVAYLNKTSKKNYGINISFQYNKRLGYESIVGDVSKGEYLIIGENQPYNSTHQKVSIKGLYEKKGNTSWSIQPSISAGKLEISYATPYRLMQVSVLEPGLQAACRHSFGKSLLSLNLSGAYHNTSNEKLELNEFASGQILENKQSVYDTYNSLIADYTQTCQNITYYYSLKKTGSIYLRLQAEQRWYNQPYLDSGAALVAIGLIF